MKTTRFLIKCKDGVTRFVFCRSMNSSDKLTGSQVISTDSKSRAYVAYAKPEEDLAYFQEHSNGCEITIA